MTASVAGVLGNSGSTFRGGTLSNRPGVRYPTPYFDMGQTYLPRNFKDMLKWCRYYFLTHPLINAVVYKMAEYAITPFIYKTDDERLRKHYMILAEDILSLRPFAIEVGLDYYCYGNAFVSVHFPFKKYLICPQCKGEFEITSARKFYEFRNLRYHFKECPKCGHYGEVGVRDHYIPSPRDIRLIRWNPENIEIDYQELTGNCRYYYKMPMKTRNEITIGKREVIETIPDIYIETIRKNQQLVFNTDSLFHLKRPTIAQKDQGWGMPLILPVMKSAYYMQILNKGQEMIAQEHIVPLRILFPQGGDAASSPYTNIDLKKWTTEIEKEIMRWKLDQNYIPVMPLPVGHQIIGGNGRAMVLHQELRMLGEFMVAGMNVPQEFVFGGLQYSGTNVSLRMLENHFLGYRNGLLHLLRDFVLRRIARKMKWPEIDMEFKRFKMADDLQRLFYFQQLNQAGKVSDRTLLLESDIDPEVEEPYLRKEMLRTLETQRMQQLGTAAVQGEAGLVQMRYSNRGQAEAMEAQAKAQQAIQTPPQPAGVVTGAPTPPQDPGATQLPAPPTPGSIPGEMQSQLSLVQGQQGPGMSVKYIAQRVAAAVLEAAQMDQGEALRQLQFLKVRNPQLHGLVRAIINRRSAGHGNENPLDALQQPMPEQRPPRREPAMG